MSAESENGRARSRGLVLVAPPLAPREPCSGRDVLSESRALWALLEPSRHEVETGVLHVQQALHKPSRSRTRRRVLPLVACVFAFGGALAYAAQGGLRDVFSERYEPAAAPAGVMAARLRAVLRDRPVVVSERRTEIVGRDASVTSQQVERHRERPVEPNRFKAEQPTPLETTLAEAPVEALGSDEAAAQESRARSWDTIGRALADGDSLLAERTLKVLMASGHAPTAAKAELGWAQLSLAKGDCVAARRSARALLEHPAASSAVRRGAERILQSCE